MKKAQLDSWLELLDLLQTEVCPTCKEILVRRQETLRQKRVHYLQQRVFMT